MHSHEESLGLRDDYHDEEDSLLFSTAYPRISRDRTITRWAARYLRRPHTRTLPGQVQHHSLLCPIVGALVKILGYSIVVLVSISIIDGIVFPSYTKPQQHYRNLERTIQLSPDKGRGNIHSEKIFIAANIIQADLLRGHWGTSVVQLIDLLGPQNVFLSIVENDSGQDTQDALEDLKAKVPCEYSIVTGAHISYDNLPKVMTPSGKARVKRLAYLAEIRNRLLWPLDPARSHDNVARINYTMVNFDRILFLNDIYMRPVDALHLLFSTNVDPLTRRADYSVACSIDFVRSVMFYDTFVVRDFEGYGMGLMFFPWFTANGRGESRKDVLKEKDAVRVRSCWGGMAAYEAKEFQRQAHAGSQDVSSIDGQNEVGLKPLRFRYSSELFWEASECCLLNADMIDRQPDRRDKIFINPYIRVAYDAKSWSWLPYIRRIERTFIILQYIVSAIRYPEFNPRRNHQAGEAVTVKQWVYEKQGYNGERLDMSDVQTAQGTRLAGQWFMKEEKALPGGFCGQRRLFVMKQDLLQANSGGSGRNWDKVDIPS